MKIRVPATSANLGPGFDSCGIAISMYLFIEVIDDAESWEIMHDFGEAVPSDGNNLLIQTVQKITKNLPPKRIKMTSDIPLARGLGSSSSVIAAGIELANRLGNLNLTQKQKIELGTQFEGHPDNITPAICGGFVVSSQIKKSVYYVQHSFPTCDIIAYIPKDQLLTAESRNVLPKTILYPKGIQASAIANVLVAALMNKNLVLAGKMMAKDQWHERYRQDLVPHLKQIRSLGEQVGVYGSFLSGAGPTVLILSPKEKTASMMKTLLKIDQEADCLSVSIDQEGIQVF